MVLFVITDAVYGWWRHRHDFGKGCKQRSEMPDGSKNTSWGSGGTVSPHGGHVPRLPPPRLPLAKRDALLAQIVGNLIYYRYINSAIVSPDAFDVIDVGASKGLTNDQRRNLGSIAKILQFAAANTGVSGRGGEGGDEGEGRARLAA